MKKIKLNKKLLNKIKNKLVLIVLPISIAISFVGCNSEKHNTKEETISNSYYSEIEDDKTSEVVESNEYDSNVEHSWYTDSIEQDVLETTIVDSAQESEYSSNINDFDYTQDISFKNIDTSSLENTIKSKRAHYQYENLYNTKTTLDKYYSIKEYESKKNFVLINESNSEINKNEFKEVVKQNTKNFLANNKKASYSELTESNFNTIFDTVCYILNYRLKDDIDKEQLEEKIANLKIVQYNESGYGALTDDNTILAINTNTILKNGNTTFLSMVAAHETNHLVQINSETEEKEEQLYKKNLGILYDFDDENINALNYQWLEEAAAEELMKYNLDEVDSKSIQYTNQVSALESISFSTIPKSDVDAITLSKLLCQSDLDKVFDLFNCETEEDKIEVINMFYTFETIFNTKFCKAHNITQDNVYKFDNQNVMITTLTKNFYLNLTNTLKDNNESLQNIFYLIDTFETEMNKLSGGSIKNDDYYIIKNEFMNTLGYSIGTSDITTVYNSFKGNSVIGDSYCLSADDQGFLSYVDNDISRSYFKVK